MEEKRESKICPSNGINIPANIGVDKLDEGIAKAKELVSLLREANELTKSLNVNSAKPFYYSSNEEIIHRMKEIRELEKISDVNSLG